MNDLVEMPKIKANEITKPKKSKSTSILPTSQFDLLTLGESVAKKWANNPQITLMWVKVEELQKAVTEFRTFLEQRVEAGSGRGSQTQTLADLDKQINQAVTEVKLSILAKFGKAKGKAYFSEFGITKQNNALRLPNDRNQRVNALPLFVKAVLTYKLQVAGFETSFFETILPTYTEAFQATQKTDSAVSISVSNKNDFRKQVEVILSALYAVIKINYPNTYEGELRGWGFQKEKY